ncbi:hypothetical protein RRG08_030204 [Elysia crispata]|uniref:Uncharacterized protein n=1 Tax=Elysia crispata TaxID=231223 RepID=A0AAE1ATL8_9GAST|nr:hypothetical protein RRG08_030204 [Elysia crispata]
MDGHTHRLPKPKSRGERMVELALSKIKSTSDLPTKQDEAGTSFDPFDIDPEDPFDVGSWHYGVDADDVSSDAYIPSSVPESSDSGEESEVFPIQEIDTEKLSTATKTVPEAREESDHDVCPLPKVVTSNVQNTTTETVPEARDESDHDVCPLPKVVTSNVQNTTTEKKKPKRPCYYCGEEQSQLVRHLTRKHKMEDAVVAALKLPKMEQRRAFEKIRKDGILKMNNVLEREHFDTLCDSIRDLTTGENGEIKAGLKLKIGYVLKKLIKTAKGYYIQTNEMEKSVEVDRFSAVLDLNWDYIFYKAQVMCEQRRNTLRKPQAMPVEEDVSKLRAFILNEMQKLSDDELMKWDHHDFVKMRNLIVSRLTMFNARRGGEPARLTLQEWEEAANNSWVDPQLVQTVKDPLEKSLFKQFKLAYQAGKGSKKLVPILIPIDTVKPIMQFIEQRIEVEISDANPFLFANTGTSLDHAVGWQCIKAVIKMMGPELEKPDLLIADKFRHRLSTLYAVLELPANEREAFYRHMGHSEAINKHVYQCPLSIGEVVNCQEKQIPQSPPLELSMSSPTNRNYGQDHINEFETEDNVQQPTPEELEKLPDLTSGSSKKNVSEATDAKKGTRRYCKWSIKNTNLVKEFFTETIHDCTSKGSKGSLPGKTSILAFLEKHPIFKERETSKFSLKEQISLVKTKIFNERNKARSSFKCLTE